MSVTTESRELTAENVALLAAALIVANCVDLDSKAFQDLNFAESALFISLNKEINGLGGLPSGLTSVEVKAATKHYRLNQTTRSAQALRQNCVDRSLHMRQNKNRGAEETIDCLLLNHQLIACFEDMGIHFEVPDIKLPVDAFIDAAVL